MAGLLRRLRRALFPDFPADAEQPADGGPYFPDPTGLGGYTTGPVPLYGRARRQASEAYARSLAPVPTPEEHRDDRRVVIGIDPATEDSPGAAVVSVEEPDGGLRILGELKSTLRGKYEGRHWEPQEWVTFELPAPSPDVWQAIQRPLSDGAGLADGGIVQLHLMPNFGQWRPATPVETRRIHDRFGTGGDAWPQQAAAFLWGAEFGRDSLEGR